MTTTTIQNALNEEAVSTPKKQFLSSILTGQIAGLIMAVAVMAVFALVYGKGPLYPVQVIGSVFIGESALKGLNILAVLTGLVLHQLGPSLLWGALFGVAATKIKLERPLDALLAGLILGGVSMVGPYFLIPFVFQHTQGIDLWNREVPLFWDWVAHLIFGASFILYPWVQSKMNKEKV